MNKTNYASIDDEALTDAVSQLVPISYSQYLSAQTVKVDFVLDKPTVIEGDQALQPQTLPVNIELGKRYIVSADIELLSISGTISHFDVGIDFTSEYDDFVNIINGITFFTVNKNKTYPPEHGHSTGWKEIGIYTHVLKPQDKIIVDF
ncbi:MAG: hypothetical protein MJ233_03565 [Mycoplasmoidaceae bacterium]|nr:hypothetical protein [Mycoplasmoidaceae bacterium]